MTQADESALEAAVHWPPPGARQRIGEMLLDEGLIRPADLQAALELQRRTGLRLGETIVTLGFVSSFDVARVLARRLEVDFVDLDEASVDPAVAAAVPEEVARRYRALAIRRTDAGVVVVMCDPRDVFAIDDLRSLLGGPVLPALADPGQIDAAIARAWANAPRTRPSDSGHGAGDSDHHAGDRADSETDDTSGRGSRLGNESPVDRDDRRLGASVTPIDSPIDSPIDTLVHTVLADAIEQRATDVHFEPGPTGVRVRFRVDGTLHDVDAPSLAGHSSAMSVIKILAGVDTANAGRPHHGRFSVAHDDRTVEVTLSTLPAADGEVAVLHIRDESPRVRELGSLGLAAGQKAAFETALRLPQGLVVAGGPTGSGRRATAYAALAELNRPDRSVVAVEPAAAATGSRYVIDGVKQIRVDPRSGLTRASALQSVLRADADVILVGAVDDPEAARSAVDAARLGRLVLATVDAPRATAIPLRLVDLGVEPFVVTAALTCAVAQRLVRRLCTRCSEPHRPDAAEREHLGLPDELVEENAIRRAVGCQHCGGSGYRGRLAIYEVLPMSDTVARLVTTGATSRDIERWAVADGMDTLRMSAFRRVADGVLSLDELSRVIG